MAAWSCSDNKDPIPLMEKPEEHNPWTLVGKLKEVWAAKPDKEAIVYYDDDDTRSSITNKDLMLYCERFSSIVRNEGIKKGDTVCNMVRPGIEKQVADFGLMLAGVVVMDGSDIDDTSDLFWQPIRQAKVNAIVMEPHPEAAGWKKLKDQVGADAFVERYTGSDCWSLRKLFVFKIASRKYDSGPGAPTVTPVLEHLAMKKGRWVEAMYAHDPCCIFVERCRFQKHYKLVIRTHSEMCLLAERALELLNYGEKDIIYNDWPLTWLFYLPLSYIVAGCTVVKSCLAIYEEKTVVGETWDLLVKEKCTIASLRPPMIQMLASHCSDLPEPYWRLNAITTTYNVNETMLDAIGVLTLAIHMCYSHIEAGLVSRMTVTEHNRRDYRRGCVGNKDSTVRTDFNFNQSPQTSKVCDILLSGRLVIHEYYHDDNLTKCCFTSSGGAFITGDLGYTDKGCLYVMGRKGDAIIRNNTAIFPGDIEERINQCEGVWRVKIVCVRDNLGIQQMCTCVLPRSQDSVSVDDIKEFYFKKFGDDKDVDPTHVLLFNEFPLRKGRVDTRLLTRMASEILNTTLSTPSE